MFERFPELRAGFLEGSCGWLAWWLWRLDEERDKVGDADRVQLRRAPSEIFAEHCWVAEEPDEELVSDVVAKVGDDRLVIATDWPHDDSSYPHAMDYFLAIEGLSQDTRRKIL